MGRDIPAVFLFIQLFSCLDIPAHIAEHIINRFTFRDSINEMECHKSLFYLFRIITKPNHVLDGNLVTRLGGTFHFNLSHFRVNILKLFILLTKQRSNPTSIGTLWIVLLKIPKQSGQASTHLLMGNRKSHYVFRNPILQGRASRYPILNLRQNCCWR